MRSAIISLLLLLIGNLSQAIHDKNESTLRLLHVIFRHGNRNPEESSIWEGNTFRNESYYPEGFGQLTNEGKQTEYKLGKLLRKRYDSFLGDIWNINIQDFRTTDYNRTKMSGLLVQAGLWPPRGSNIWSLLSWQPIPYNYVPLREDSLLFPLYCPGFARAFAGPYGSEEIQSYLAERYNETMQILSENTGLSTTNYFTAALGYFDTMKIQEELGYPLDNWTSLVYPEPLNSLAVDMYYILTNTTALRQVLAGTHLKKILADTTSFINGTLTPSSRKLFTYSAHDTNVGSFILSLDAYTIYETPPYGAAVLFEVHEIKGVWGIKLFYVDYEDGSPHPLAIPGCAKFCPIGEFTSLVQEILPESDVCNGS